MAKRLSLDETAYYLRMWREGGDEDALTLLAVSNRTLVTYFAKSHLGKGLDFDELFSAGNEGLVKAINKFNFYDKPIECFSSYISTAIDNQMRLEIQRYRKHSHVLSFEQPLGQNKDGEELKLEDIIGTDGEELLQNVISEMKIDVVREALKSLTRREQQIILLRYGLDDKSRKTQKELAEMFSCSPATIASAEKRALVKMRHPKNTQKLKDFRDD